MKFLTPLGLLGLLAIIALIIIYIIKPRYYKKPISSTFVWNLSLKYRKRRIPLQWLQKSLLFFIQVIIIILIAILLAKPSILIASNDGEKIIILDTSYSMNAKSNNKTRLDRAINELKDVIKDVNEENKLTIIIGNNQPEYLVRRETSKNYIEYALSNVHSTYGECDFDAALLLANTVIDENPASRVYFYTDCEYENSGYVEVVNFQDNEWNVAVLEFDPAFENGYYTFKTKIGNYNKDASIKLLLELNDGKIKYEQDLNMQNNQEIELNWKDLNILDYTNAKLTILDQSNKNIDDSLKEDNEFYYQNLNNITYDVQLVGATNTFMNASLKSLGNVNLSLPKTEEEVVLEGKDFYVFDGYLPDTLPIDGTLWLINPKESHKDLEIVVCNEVEGDNVLLSENNESSIAKEIMNYVYPSDIKVTKYTKITNYNNYEVLITCDGNPVLLVGKHGNTKVVILALDLHYTTLPLSFNMAILTHNIFTYGVKNTIENSVYNVGDSVTLHTKPITEQLYVNDELEMDKLSFEDNVIINVSEPGIYNVHQSLTNNEEKDDYFFVRVSANESNYRYTRDVLAVDQYINLETGIVGEPGGGTFDYKEISIYFAAALLLLLIIEWGVQYREQY